jgi:carbamoyltransferase
MGTKELLNVIKDRESYRPVAPICLEEDAPDIFQPGTRDPFMLFDHQIKAAWKDRVPAVIHLDNTARLQTVSESDNPVVYRLLQEFKTLTGIPLLCNTSANFKGKGFFPDVSSAMKWDRVNYIWCDKVLYKRKRKIVFGCKETTEVYAASIV